MHTLALALALLIFADTIPPAGVVIPPARPGDPPITIPPAGVVIPPARPGDPPLQLTVPYNPDAADKADFDALAKTVADLSRRVDALSKATATCTCAAPCPCPTPLYCPESCVPRCRHSASATAPVPPVAASPPTLYQLTDASGQTWTYPDPTWLQTYVAQRNASLAAPRPTPPAYGGFAFPPAFGAFGGFSGGCAGGNCR